MGLDIYVGPLCRYYSGAWLTIIQQEAPELGLEVEMVRPANEPDAITDPNEALPLVLEWRDQLQEGLRPYGVQLSWDEDPAGDYFTDKPAWDCYGSLILWASYHEHPTLSPPAIYPGDWSTDPAFVASTRQDFKTRYPQLLHHTELWLPADFPFVFTAADPAGGQMVFGSVVRLLGELNQLNSASWALSDDEVNHWRREGSELGAPLEHAARFCMAIMLSLAEKAVTERLPLKLDY